MNDLAVTDAAVTDDSVPLLQVEQVRKLFPLKSTGSMLPFGKGHTPLLHAVDGVDLSIGRGESVGLVGESGCGKSTVARLITRIHTPTSGSIRFAGTEIATAEPAAIRPLSTSRSRHTHAAIPQANGNESSARLSSWLPRPACGAVAITAAWRIR